MKGLRDITSFGKVEAEDDAVTRLHHSAYTKKQLSYSN